MNTTATLTTTKWTIDPAHSEIQFKVKHLMITTVTGNFKDYALDVITEGEDFTKTTQIVFTADVNSINTQNEQRDNHLKSDDFFDAINHGQIKFIGKRLETAGSDYQLQGDLTIRGITKPITLKVTYRGVAVDPWGQTKAGFSIKGKISRKEFGLTWGVVTEAGQVVVGDEVKINCEVQLIKQG
ncbi:YceI family protein [Cesiribacter sp. SM1]|uniref:YceI family protein n=1 Tax=Cesiribacter sp. SM1 TaxID=2861196 RepID=UPI001CD2FB26|nr:YceI family protein [Cesiribacter sp. SM1]